MTQVMQNKKKPSSPDSLKAIFRLIICRWNFPMKNNVNIEKDLELYPFSSQLVVEIDSRQNY